MLFGSGGFSYFDQKFFSFCTSEYIGKVHSAVNAIALMLESQNRAEGHSFHLVKGDAREGFGKIFVFVYPGLVFALITIGGYY